MPEQACLRDSRTAASLLDLSIVDPDLSGAAFLKDLALSR